MAQQTSSLVFLHYLTTVFDSIEEAILLIGVEEDEHYRLLIANQAYARNTGRVSIPVGELLSDSVDPETFETLKKQYRQVVTTKQPMSFTQQYKVPLGMQTYAVRLLPILNSVGEVVQIAGIARNVTEIENLREELRKLRRQAKKKA